MTHDNPRRNSHGGGQRRRPLALPPLISFLVVVLLLIGWVPWPYGFEFVGMMGWGTPGSQLNCCVVGLLLLCLCDFVVACPRTCGFWLFAKKDISKKSRGFCPNAN